MSVDDVVAPFAALAARAGIPSLAGHFANVVDVGGVRLALSTDGVGTKHLLANRPEHFTGIAIDCAAMNANDVICVGARPVALLDYLAIADTEGVAPYAEAIAAGFAAAAAEGAGEVVGGEVAVLPEVIAARSDGVPGLDLAAAVVGVLEGELLDGAAVVPGDVVVGIASSGVHSNGFTRLRSLVAEAGLGLDSPSPWGSSGTVRDDLLVPTRLYPLLCAGWHDAGVELHAVAHLTGGGLSNLCRVLPSAGLVLDAWPSRSPLFAWIADRAGAVEAWSTFNMGAGLVGVVPPGAVDAALTAAKDAGYDATVIGEAARTAQVGTVELRLETETLLADRHTVRAR